ncbi:MAG: hypothetical protein ACPHY8_01465 [Patescibacteria group bacterium]
MDKIKEKLDEEYKTSQSDERDKYDFTKFFTNNFGDRVQVVDVIEDDEGIDLTPPVVNEALPVEILKR